MGFGWGILLVAFTFLTFNQLCEPIENSLEWDQRAVEAWMSEMRLKEEKIKLGHPIVNTREEDVLIENDQAIEDQGGDIYSTMQDRITICNEDQDMESQKKKNTKLKAKIEDTDTIDAGNGWVLGWRKNGRIQL